ncbi:MAG: MarR family transcriptional regulator, partial [Leptospiraceae bacterium]|nr:MarR family transcriptional regulator [Leptospiraceae bacterium]
MPEYEEKDTINLKLMIALNRCWQSVQKNEKKVISEAGLTMAQFGVLELLYHKGPMRICTIIEKTLSSGGNLTVVIDNLEKQKLVKRKPDPADRRAHLIHLTSAGRLLIEKLFPLHMANLQDVLSILDQKEKLSLI